jgi:hypothetical protein
MGGIPWGCYFIWQVGAAPGVLLHSTCLPELPCLVESEEVGVGWGDGVAGAYTPEPGGDCMLEGRPAAQVLAQVEANEEGHCNANAPGRGMGCWHGHLRKVERAGALAPRASTELAQQRDCAASEACRTDVPRPFQSSLGHRADVWGGGDTGASSHVHGFWRENVQGCRAGSGALWRPPSPAGALWRPLAPALCGKEMWKARGC